MVDLHLLGTTIDSTLLFQVVGIILTLFIIYFAYLNYHKKPASSSKVSQSSNNSSGIVQQNADRMIIGEQKITIYDKKDERVIESTKLKLNEIDSQLKDLYLPMDEYLRQYIKTVTASSTDSHLLDIYKSELEKKIGELRTRYPGRVDMQVLEFSGRFFEGVSPPEVFRNAVGIKIRSLLKEKENLINEFDKKGQ